MPSTHLSTSRPRAPLKIGFVALNDCAPLLMARELDLGGRKFWIVSDPEGNAWKARVLEMRANGEQDEIGIDASAQTRTAADSAAERKLRRLLGLP